jgi:hypothetical protein
MYPSEKSTTASKRKAETNSEGTKKLLKINNEIDIEEEAKAGKVFKF